MRKPYRKYHKDGSIWAKGFMLGGKMEGTWVWFRKDGSKMRSGSFVKGTQVGTWTTYGTKGKVVKVTVMSDKKLKDGARCKVIAGTHMGKSGIVKDIKKSATGAVTITVVPANGVRFKTLAKNVEVI